MAFSKEYYEESLSLAYKRLHNKCDYFDCGDALIAIDIAVQIRVLLHDTKCSKSLLRHLNYKNIDSASISFVDSTFSDWKTGLSHCSFGDGFSNHIVIQQEYPRYAFLHRRFEQNGDIIYSPLLNCYANPISFLDWWKNQEICAINNQLSLTRCDLILILCNKDGGTHYDTKIDDNHYGVEYNDYFALKSKTSLGVILDGKNAETKNVPLFVSVRQIAHEVIETLKPIIPT